MRFLDANVSALSPFLAVVSYEHFPIRQCPAEVYYQLPAYRGRGLYRIVDKSTHSPEVANPDRHDHKYMSGRKETPDQSYER